MDEQIFLYADRFRQCPRIFSGCVRAELSVAPDLHHRAVPAGRGDRVLARFLGERMREALGQPVVVENVSGAAGTLGVGRAVRAAPDGYTLSVGTSTTHMLTGGL